MKGINYKLVNIALILVIIALLYLTGNVWTGIISKTFEIIFPFIISFAIAYALYPYYRYLMDKKVPKSLSIIIVFITVIVILLVVLFNVVPLIVSQLSSLFTNIINFFINISNKFDIDFGTFNETLKKVTTDIVANATKYVSDGAINFIGLSFTYITNFFIIVASTIYFLIDMDSIRLKLKKKLKANGRYNYVKKLDDSMKNYLIGFFKILLITYIEYTILYLIIGHPNAILIGFLAAIAGLIPYFGGLSVNIIAIITAAVVSPMMLIKTIIVFLITSALDSYVINPLVYGKSNKIHPIITILAVVAGGALMGVLGIIISLPLSIIIIETYNYYEKQISKKIDDLKDIV